MGSSVLEFDRNPALSDVERLQSFMESVQRAFNEFEVTFDDLELEKHPLMLTVTKDNKDFRVMFKDYGEFKVITTNAIEAVKGDFRNLYAEMINADKIIVEDIEAIRASIGELDADVADINTLIFGSASGDVIQTSFANAVIAQLGNAQIKSAMIDSVAADKITAGDIITNNVKVMSEDGKLLISDETIQISDDTRVRVQVGKDASGDYSINIWDADGNLMFSEGGITDSAIKKAIIRNDMVAEDANIAGSKLDISSVFTEMNKDGTETLKATKVHLDDKNQTLEVAFKEMSDDVSSQGTAIEVVQGQINSKIWSQDIDTATEGLATEESVTTLSTHYSELDQKIDEVSLTVADHTTELSNKADSSEVAAVSDRVTEVVADLDGFRTSVSETYATQEALSKATSSIEQNAEAIKTKVEKTDLDGYVKKTTFEQTAESITSQVESLEGQVSKFEQTADGFEFRLEEIKEEMTTNLRIESSRGTVFKNNEVATILSAVIYRGSKRITDMATLKSEVGPSAYLQWSWQRLDETNYGVISSSDSRIGNNGFTFTLTPEDVDTKVTFMCELIT